LAIENYFQTMRGGVEDVANTISDMSALEKITQNSDKFADQERVMQKVEDLMRIALVKEGIDLEALIEEFFALVVMSGLDLDTLYRLYVGKNILNQFRQDHGYKDGSYIKIWDGEEDNVVMKRIWEEQSDVTPEMLYRELTKHYLALTKSE